MSRDDARNASPSPWATALAVVTEHRMFPAALFELFRLTQPELRANGLPPDPATFGSIIVSERAMEGAICAHAPAFDRLHYDSVSADEMAAYKVACAARGVVLGRGPVACSGLGEMWVLARYPDAAACARAVERLQAVQSSDEGPAEERGYRVFAKEIGIDRVESAEIFGALVTVVSLGRQALLRHQYDVPLSHVLGTGGEVGQVLRDLHVHPAEREPQPGTDTAWMDVVICYVRHALLEGPHQDAVALGDDLRAALTSLLRAGASSFKVLARGDHGVEVVVVPRDALSVLPRMAEVARGLGFDMDIELCRAPSQALPTF